MRYNGESVIRRFTIMGCCSLMLHMMIAVIILSGAGSEKSANVYRVEVKYLQEKTELPEEVKPVTTAPEQPKLEESREEPVAADLTGIAAPILPEIVNLPKEAVEDVDTEEIVDIVETPVPPVENAVVTPGGGLGSGADTEAGGGNSPFATGTGRGWGGDAAGEGWGGGSGSPGSGGETGNSLGRAGGEQEGVYFAGMPGITPPVYDRAPQPSYPEASRARGEKGEVLLKVEVLTNGRVGRVEVEKSSGYARLDETAFKTVQRWRFKPALKGREAVACWVNIPIRFALN